MTTRSPAHSPFEGSIQRLIDDSSSVRLEGPSAPEGAPNVVLIMLDDVGFGSCSTFGGPVPTPTVDRVAESGLRYNQFHTTALCSPTRAALLTGRNHHAVHMGGITEIANSFPVTTRAIPASGDRGRDPSPTRLLTGCFGKWHLTPSGSRVRPARSIVGRPGMGFERFYGIIGAEASHWEPRCMTRPRRCEPHVGRDDYHLTEDLADKAIEWMHARRSRARPPVLLLLLDRRGACAHHVWPEWIDDSRAFDEGWDALREQIYPAPDRARRDPPETPLTPRPDEVPVGTTIPIATSRSPVGSWRSSPRSWPTPTHRSAGCSTRSTTLVSATTRW